MIILKDLLDKYEIDYAKFPKNILNIEINEEISNLEYIKQNKKDIFLFYGEYYDEDIPNKTLVKSTVEIDLTGMTVNEIEIYEKITIIQDKNPETYGLKTEEELLEILKKGLSKDFVTVIKNVSDIYTDFKTYNIFGGISKEG